MKRLKSRRECPPAGFHYHQPETGWRLETWDFEQLCQEIQRHRQANPKFKLSLDLNSIREEVDSVNAERVSKIPGADIYVLEKGYSPPKTTAPLRAGVAAGVGAKVSNIASGAALLVDWLGSGAEPVDRGTAESRAVICSLCPLNTEGGLEKFFTVPLANKIKQQIELKHEMSLVTSIDENLNVCSACTCPLKLKVWAPRSFIVEYMSEEVMEKLDKNCWITHATQ